MQVAAQSQELEVAITANAKAKDDLRNWLEDFEKLAGRAPSEDDKQRAGHLFSAIEQASVYYMRVAADQRHTCCIVLLYFYFFDSSFSRCVDILIT